MDFLGQWRDRIRPLIDELQRAAGTTEHEFLEIGSRLQEFYVRSRDGSRLASKLVVLVSDDDYHVLVAALRRMTEEMGEYLEASRLQNRESCNSLGRVLELLATVSEPLATFRKMDKTLRMLGISTKIESARLAGRGNGFTTLALDVEKLSCLVREKTDCIRVKREFLETMVVKHLHVGKESKEQHTAEANALLRMATTRIDELTELNARCSGCGELVGHISNEVSSSINEVVSSLQIHDIMRQQTEHVVEALAQLLEDSGGEPVAGENDERFAVAVGQVGDVCELQVAQIQNATSELHGAVVAIIASLHDIGERQALLSREVMAATGTSGNSFFHEMRTVLTGLGTILRTCAAADRMFFATLRNIADTINEIAGFVGSIEEISVEINLIALNSQIRAAHTGQEGVALGVLAEGIKSLSEEAVPQADALLQTLSRISEVTDTLVKEAECELTALGVRLVGMEGKTDEIVSSLERMNEAISRHLADLMNSVGELNGDIHQLTSSITVHDAVEELTREVAAVLEAVVTEARVKVPATNEFAENLRHMAAHYTMQSERHIHESIARRRAGLVEVCGEKTLPPDVAGSASEFGDNVELF